MKFWHVYSDIQDEASTFLADSSFQMLDHDNIPILFQPSPLVCFARVFVAL